MGGAINPFAVERALETLTVIVDTREQANEKATQRLQAIGLPLIRRKLDFGDYSAEVTIDGNVVSFERDFVIERKMNLDELCTCYTRERERFVREFERAANAGAKTYLLVENATWEKAYNGVYRSKVAPNALVASMTTWLARYNCQLLMCNATTSGRLIGEILKREAKEKIEKMIDL